MQKCIKILKFKHNYFIFSLLLFTHHRYPKKKIICRTLTSIYHSICLILLTFLTFIQPHLKDFYPQGTLTLCFWSKPKRTHERYEQRNNWYIQWIRKSHILYRQCTQITFIFRAVLQRQWTWTRPAKSCFPITCKTDWFIRVQRLFWLNFNHRVWLCCGKRLLWMRQR